MELLPILEGILFLVGDEGIAYEEIKKILEIEDDKLNSIIEELKQEYNSEKRGIQLEKLGNKYKLTTKKEHKKYYELLTDAETSNVLSPAALETLAIIAYNQPVTRVQIDEIRGIGSSHLVRKLLLKNLIKDVGRSDSPGRPILYGVTNEFLDYFGLNSVDELPNIEKIEVEEDTADLFTSKYKEEL